VRESREERDPPSFIKKGRPPCGPSFGCPRNHWSPTTSLLTPLKISSMFSFLSRRHTPEGASEPPHPPVHESLKPPQPERVHHRSMQPHRSTTTSTLEWFPPQCWGEAGAHHCLSSVVSDESPRSLTPMFTSLGAAIHRSSSAPPLHPPLSHRELEREEVSVGFPRVLRSTHA
jgi:hypothetical protein